MKKFIFILLSSLFILEVSLRIMGFGYKIIRKPSYQKDKDSFVIFCLGESTTEGQGAALDKNYPSQLEELLNENIPGGGFQVVHDSTIGWSSSRILRKFPEYIKKYKPQLVVAMVGVNNWLCLDQSNILLFNENKNISHYTYRILVFLEGFRAFKFFRLLYYYGLIHYYKARGISNENESFDPWHKNPSIQRLDFWELCYLPHIEELYNKILRYDLTEIVKICQENDIEIIISGYPMGNCRSIHMEIAEKFKVPFVDNYKSFRRLREKDLLSEYISKDGWHPNEKGYAIIAGNVYRTLVDNKPIFSSRE